MSEKESRGRRRALKVFIALGSAAVAGLLAIPGAAYVLDPILRRTRRATDFRTIGSESVLRDDRPVALPVIGEVVDAWTRTPEQRLGTVWLQKRPDGELSALSAECPHLGCRIAYDDGQEHFTCPCHESAFGLDGSVSDGPSPRPMDPLEARIENGKIQVRFVRYRTQTDEKVEIG